MAFGNYHVLHLHPKQPDRNTYQNGNKQPDRKRDGIFRTSETCWWVGLGLAFVKILMDPAGSPSRDSVKLGPKPGLWKSTFCAPVGSRDIWTRQSQATTSAFRKKNTNIYGCSAVSWTNPVQPPTKRLWVLFRGGVVWVFLDNKTQRRSIAHANTSLLPIHTRSRSHRLPSMVDPTDGLPSSELSTLRWGLGKPTLPDRRSSLFKDTGPVRFDRSSITRLNKRTESVSWTSLVLPTGQASTVLALSTPTRRLSLADWQSGPAGFSEKNDFVFRCN